MSNDWHQPGEPEGQPGWQGEPQNGHQHGGPNQGGYQQGPPQQGGYQQGPPQQGGYQQGPPQQGGYQQGPPQQGGYQQGPPPQGGYQQGPPQQGQWQQQQQPGQWQQVPQQQGQWPNQQGQPQQGQWGPPPKKRRTGMIAMVVVLVAALATAGGLVFVNRTVTEAGYTILDEPAFTTEPVFQERDARGPDPFFPLETQLAVFQEEQTNGADGSSSNSGGGSGGDDGDDEGTGGESGDTASAAAFTIEELEAATKTGLYGGTEENTCDPERLISFLIANPELGEAWAQVQGITFAELPTYIRSLDVEVLAEPVRVLNHGYNTTTKTAYEIETVLDAGTAVLVDADGDIRTRCYCGNPIVPPPPTGHKPPTCLVLPHAVFVEPGSSRRRPAVPGTVNLTGRTANRFDRAWVEVMWGTDADEMGWTLKSNARPNVYCRPDREIPKCPTTSGAPVYSSPTAEIAFGQLGGDGEIPVDELANVRGQVKPVGGPGDRTVVNGRLLIHFGHPTKPIKSGWIPTSAINEQSSPSECQTIRVCVDVESVLEPSTAAVMGDVGPGFHRVELTGRVVGTGLEEIARIENIGIEVRLLERGNRTGWIFVTDLQGVVPDAQCKQDRITLCKRSAGFDNGDILLRDPTSNPVRTMNDIYERVDAGELTLDEGKDAIDALDLSNIAGYAGNIDVVLIGSAQPTNGLVQVQVAGNGPIGWVPLATLDGDACVPTEVCVQIDGPAYTTYPDSGSVVPGTPMSAPGTVKLWQAVGVEPDSAGVLNSDNLFADVRFLMGIGEARGWVDPVAATGGQPDSACNPPQVTCPPTAVTAAGEQASPGCCAFVDGEWQQVALTGRQQPGEGGGTEVEVSAPSGVSWVDHPEAFATSVDQCVANKCPELANGSSAIPETDACCIVTRTDTEVTFLEVDRPASLEVTGTTEFVPGEFCQQQPDCAEGLQLDDGSCEPVSDECPADQVRLTNGDCVFERDPECPPGQLLDNGRCTTPCNANEETLADGTCRPLCPSGQSRLSNGTCGTNISCPDGKRVVNGECVCPDGIDWGNNPCECPAGTARVSDGTCLTTTADPCQAGDRFVDGQCLCPDGGARLGDGSCLTTGGTVCDAGMYAVGNGLCCPNGTELLPNTTRCATPCAADETRNANGECESDCPRERLTILSQCCPVGQEGNRQGACVEKCATGPRDLTTGYCQPEPCASGNFDASGACCPQGQVVDSASGQCTTPGTNPPPPDPGTQCEAGEVIASDGECCPTFYPNQVGWLLIGNDCVELPNCPAGSEVNLGTLQCEQYLNECLPPLQVLDDGTCYDPNDVS